LVPGQQVQLTTSSTIKVNNNVDLDEVVAWKKMVIQIQRIVY